MSTSGPNRYWLRFGAASAAVLMVAVTIVGVFRETGYARLMTSKGALGVLMVTLIHTPLALAPLAKAPRWRAVCAIGMLFGAYLVAAWFAQEISRAIRGFGLRPGLALAWGVGLVAYARCFWVLAKPAPTV